MHVKKETYFLVFESWEYTNWQEIYFNSFAKTESYEKY